MQLLNQRQFVVLSRTKGARTALAPEAMKLPELVCAEGLALGSGGVVCVLARAVARALLAGRCRHHIPGGSRAAKCSDSPGGCVRQLCGLRLMHGAWRYVHRGFVRDGSCRTHIDPHHVGVDCDDIIFTILNLFHLNFQIIYFEI